MNLIAALDIGGHNIRCLLADPKGEVRARGSTETVRDAADAEANLNATTGLVRRLLADLSATDTDLVCLSLGVPGVVNPASGVVVMVPNVPHWDNLALRDRLRERFPVPVEIENDVNLAAQGEYWKGTAVGKENFFFLALGTGIGGGIFIGGRPYHGSRFSAGEIGYLALEPFQDHRRLGDLGWFESVASGLALDQDGVRAATAHPESLLNTLAGGPDAVTSAHVFEAAAEGDAAATEILDWALEYISLAVVNITALLDPDLIIFGGGMSRQGARLLEPVRERALRYGLPIPPLQPSRLGEDAQLFGALHSGLRAIE